MIVKLEKIINQQDIEVLIKYAKMNQTVQRICRLLESAEQTIKCSLESHEMWVNVNDIYYIESVDKKTFVYCEKVVYQTEFRLYQLMEELNSCGFVQISKSCIININVLESIHPLMNSRMEATLSNGECINVTRKYVAGIKAKLQER